MQSPLRNSCSMRPRGRLVAGWEQAGCRLHAFSLPTDSLTSLSLSLSRLLRHTWRTAGAAAPASASPPPGCEPGLTSPCAMCRWVKFHFFCLPLLSLPTIWLMAWLMNVTASGCHGCHGCGAGAQRRARSAPAQRAFERALCVSLCGACVSSRPQRRTRVRVV